MTEDDLFAKSKRITERIRLDVERRGPPAKAAKQKLDCECLSVDAAQKRYAFATLEHLASLNGNAPVLLIKGDVTGSVKLDRAWAKRLAAPFKQGEPACVLVDGAIEIQGDVLDQYRAELSLLVTGNVGCDYLLSRNGRTEIVGDLRTTYGVCGEFNDGVLSVGGRLLAPYIVANDHDMPRQADEEFIYLEGGDGSDEISIGQATGSGWGWGWSYFDDSDSLIAEEVWDEDETFSTEAFFDMVRRGDNPFVKR